MLLAVSWIFVSNFVHELQKMSYILKQIYIPFTQNIKPNYCSIFMLSYNRNIAIVLRAVNYL
jgi:hypothetical protein